MRFSKLNTAKISVYRNVCVVKHVVGIDTKYQDMKGMCTYHEVFKNRYGRVCPLLMASATSVLALLSAYL